MAGQEAHQNRQELFIALNNHGSAKQLMRSFVKRVQQMSISNIIDIIELYSTEDTSSADSEARAKENETKGLAKVVAALPESGQAMTHQDVESRNYRIRADMHGTKKRDRVTRGQKVVNNAAHSRDAQEEPYDC
jgi:hypothetical protein